MVGTPDNFPNQPAPSIPDFRLATIKLLETNIRNWYISNQVQRRLEEYPKSSIGELEMSDEQISRLQDQFIDMRLAVSALLETVTRHQANHEAAQRNFELLAAQTNEIRSDMRDMQRQMLTMQSEIRGLQTENNRILEVLERRLGD